MDHQHIREFNKEFALQNVWYEAFSARNQRLSQVVKILEQGITGKCKLSPFGPALGDTPSRCGGHLTLHNKASRPVTAWIERRELSPAWGNIELRSILISRRHFGRRELGSTEAMLLQLTDALGRPEEVRTRFSSLIQRHAAKLQPWGLGYQLRTQSIIVSRTSRG